MSRSRYLLALSLSFLFNLSHAAFAQNKYSVTVETAPYTDLTATTVVTDELYDPNLGHGIRIPFSMKGFGLPFDFINDPQPIYVFTGGFIGVSNSALDRLFVFDAFVSSMVRLDETSSLTYQLDGDGANKVLKFQWKNMGLQGNPVGDFVNIQLWLYAADNSFEVHIGPGRVTGTTAFSGYSGPAIGTFLSTLTLSQYFATVHLAGNPAAPSLETFNAFYPMGGVPVEGTVYRFSYTTPSSVEDASPVSDVRLYPNPTRGGFFLNLPEDLAGKVGSVVLCDLLGRPVLRATDVVDGDYLSTGELPSGTYHLLFYVSEQCVSTVNIIVAE